ncbi:MAG TPA: PaaI family thioesterase [Acidimicrobiales bacterium]|nr:PaaI family thioesterase [Acidimicrobiales bacterium]
MTFDTYDEAIARSFVKAHESPGRGGLDGWLDVRLDEMWAGGLRAVLPVRDEFLTPMGNMHGGVLSAFCDHVLGVVCYPVMARGAWAATTEFKINLVAPVTEGEAVATAVIVAMTKRSAVVRIDIENGGRAVGFAQGTVTIMPPRT